MKKGSALERVAILLLCFGYSTIGSVQMVVMGIRESEFTNFHLLQLLGAELLLGLAALVVLRRRGWTLNDFGFRISARDTLGGLLLLLVTNVACTLVYLAMNAAGMFAGWPDDAMRVVATPALMLFFLVVNSFFEEFFVVGYVIEATPANEVAFAVSVSALVRLLYHTYQGPIAAAGILPLGLIFALAYLRWRNLWPLVFAHTVMNVMWWVTS